MSIPKFIGRYEVLALIGRGGMGTVYHARDPRHRREVALKLLRRGDGADSAELVHRFVREVHMARSLTHPNIVEVFDDGEHDGMPFFVMEILTGETFEAVIKRGASLPLPDTLGLIESVCAGLGHAHAADIVHRDIKPANIMIGGDGTVKILDFGIARPVDSKMTMHGVIMGTPNYMSPEQARGDHVDARADIFAVGAVLYELLTHRKAFPGEAYEEVRKRILHTAPAPLESECPGLDPRVVEIVDHALEKLPERRYSNIDIMQRAVAGVRTTVAVSRSTGRGSGGGATAVLTPAAGAASRFDSDGEKVARQHGRHVAMRLATAEQALKSNDPESAVKSCEQALMLDPADHRAAMLLEEAYRAIQEQQIASLMRAAEQHLQAGALTEARALAESAASVNPDHRAVAALRREIDSRRVEARTDAVRQALVAAQTSLEGAEFDAADRAVETAYRLDPQSPVVAGMRAKIDSLRAAHREGERIKILVGEARRIFDSGNHDAALLKLRALPGFHPDLAQAITVLTARRDQIRAERQQQTVRSALAVAQVRMTAADFVGATAEVDRAVAADANSSDARLMRAAIEQAQRLWERQRIDAGIVDAARLFADNEHAAAIKMLEQLQPSSDARLDQTLAQFRRERTAQEAQRQRAIEESATRARIDQAMQASRQAEQQRNAEAAARRVEEQRAAAAAAAKRADADEARRVEERRRAEADAAERERQPARELEASETEPVSPIDDVELSRVAPLPAPILSATGQGFSRRISVTLAGGVLLTTLIAVALSRYGSPKAPVALSPAGPPQSAAATTTPPAPVPPTFVATLSADYPIEISLGDHTWPARKSRDLQLAAGVAHRLRVRNSDVFLDRSLTVTGRPGESISPPLPGLGSITVQLPRALESCEIAISGHGGLTVPLTVRAVAGSYEVTLPRCLDRTSDVRRIITVVAGETATVDFARKVK